jgi:mono/diheme cytochrome c family protein
MMPSHWTRALLGAAVALVWLARAVSTIGSAPQAPPGSDGWLIPAGAATEFNPAPGDSQALARGQSLYKAKCQRCHGADGTGHGPEADPDRPAGDLTDRRVAARNPDGVMFYKIWNGRAKPKMPAMKLDLTRSDVWLVVQYAKTFRQ